MNQTFTSGIAFLAVTVAVFGVLYVVDLSFGSKPSTGAYPVREIKGSVGAVSPVGQSESGTRPERAAAVTNRKPGSPLKIDKKEKSNGSQ
jgi:hypothetical protein